MSRDSLKLRAASSQDVDLLLEWMAGFNQEEKIEFDPASYRQRIQQALDLPQLVSLWLIVADDCAVGYAVLSFTFSFEFGGLLGLLDEIYIAPEHRGKGWGTAALERVAEVALQRGATTLYGDVADDKPWLANFYQRAGFECYFYRPYYRPLV